MSTNDPFAPNPYGQIPSDYSRSYQPSSGNAALGLISIVLSSFSWLLFCCCFPFPSILALGGIVCGHIAAMSIDGKVTGIIGLVLGYLNLLVTIGFFCFVLMIDDSSQNVPVNNMPLPPSAVGDSTSDNTITPEMEPSPTIVPETNDLKVP